MLFRVSKPYSYWQAERGDHYIGSHFFEGVSNNGNATLLLVAYSTKTYELSLQTHIASEGTSRLRIYEDALVSNNGTNVPIFNLSRLNGDSVNCDLYHSPTLSDNGTKIYDFLLPGGSRNKVVGASDGSFPTEIVHLKKNSNYAIVVTNLSGSSEAISSSVSIGKVI